MTYLLIDEKEITIIELNRKEDSWLMLESIAYGGRDDDNSVDSICF